MTERNKQMDQANTESKAIEQAEIKKFVRNNWTPVQDGRMCVDGRYQTASEGSAMTARAGGDFGYIELFLGLKKQGLIRLTAGEIARKVYGAVIDLSGNFWMHTDHHAEHQEKAEGSLVTGCGHIARSAKPENSGLYGVDSADVKEAFDEVTKQPQDRVKVISLPGDHGEKAVIINLGTHNTINHGKGEEQYFVYDQTLDEAFLAKLVQKLNLTGVTLEDVLKVSVQQTEATLLLLAAGKNIWKTNADDEYAAEVKFLGKVT